MTTNHHTPIPSSPKQPANAATVNAPLAELDAELTAQDSRIVTLEGDSPPYSGVAAEFLNGEGAFAVPAGTGSTNGHVIQDAGSDVTQRAKLNFTGTGVSVTDTPTATEVEITASLPETTAANDVVVGDGAGAWVKKTLAELLTILGVTSTPTANKIPQADAGGKLDGWQTRDDMTSALVNAEVSITGAATATIGRMHVCSGSSNYEVALPAASGNAGKFVGLRFTNTGITTINPNASETVDGVTTMSYYQGQAVMLMCDGANWVTLNLISHPMFVDVDADAFICSLPETKSVNTSQRYASLIFSSSPANGQTWDIPVFLQKGSYTVYCLAKTGPDAGKLDWYLDGVSQTTGQDWYSAVITYNVVKTFTLTVISSGWHKLRATTNGKNVSSSGYYWEHTKVTIIPSAY